MPPRPRHRPTATPEWQREFPLPEQVVFCRQYRGPGAGRRLLLLHGGGVDGALTWGAIIAGLVGWSEILVPDLRGTGRTRFPDACEHPFDADEVVADLDQLLAALGWDAFDLGGYSYGGLIAMLLKARQRHRIVKTFLLEPGLLGKVQRSALLENRSRLALAAVSLLQGTTPAETEAAIRLFLDVVAPGRSRNPRSERAIVERLAARPAGLARAIECVSAASRRIDRDQLIARQANVSSFIGQRSHPEFFALCRQIEAGRDDWTCHLVPGADHALPFQKPSRIAAQMNADLATLGAARDASRS